MCRYAEVERWCRGAKVGEVVQRRWCRDGEVCSKWCKGDAERC
jgi:hypothetical protein